MANVIGNKFRLLRCTLKHPFKVFFANYSDSSKKIYRAAVLNEFKSSLVLEEKHPEKKLKKDEIRIRVKHCSINDSDVLICNGQYDITPKLPFIPGYELSGEILEVGSDVNKEEYGVGDIVVALNKEKFSGLAEQCVVSAQDAWIVPSNDTKLWCALVDSYSTALIGLTRRGHVKQGEPVLITAAAGGSGLAAIDIAANVYCAKVIAVCETEDKADVVRKKGAWAALTFNPNDIKKKVKEVTGGKGVRLLFDSVGDPSTFEEMVKCVAHEGKVIVAGAAARKIPQIRTKILLPSGFSLLGVSLRNYRISASQVYRQVVQDTIDMCEQGLVSPHISESFSLTHVNDAMKYIDDQISTGKVIIEMDD